MKESGTTQAMAMALVLSAAMGQSALLKLREIKALDEATFDTLAKGQHVQMALFRDYAARVGISKSEVAIAELNGLSMAPTITGIPDEYTPIERQLPSASLRS